MTYQPKNHSVLAYANGFTLWHYDANDHKVSDVLEPTFWHNKVASEMLRFGDRVHVACKNGVVDMVCTTVEHRKPDSIKMMAMNTVWYGFEAGEIK